MEEDSREAEDMVEDSREAEDMVEAATAAVVVTANS